MCSTKLEPLLKERAERGFHYSHLAAQEHRSRFGHLAFCFGSQSTELLTHPGPFALPRDQLAAVPGDDGQTYGLPPEIVTAGEVHLTGVIADLSAVYNRSWWTTKQWPGESGGSQVLLKILERCLLIRDQKIRPVLLPPHGVVDPVLQELIEPEQRRQKSEMCKAIDRVCGLIASYR